MSIKRIEEIDRNKCGMNIHYVNSVNIKTIWTNGLISVNSAQG